MLPLACALVLLIQDPSIIRLEEEIREIQRNLAENNAGAEYVEYNLDDPLYPVGAHPMDFAFVIYNSDAEDRVYEMALRRPFESDIEATVSVPGSGIRLFRLSTVLDISNRTDAMLIIGSPFLSTEMFAVHRDGRLELLPARFR